MAHREELNLILRAARLYYEDGLTQQQVARELGISRPKVSRLLSQAREEGIVRINILDPFSEHSNLEKELVAAFGLRQAVVTTCAGVEAEILRRRIGFAAAEFLACSLVEGQQIGIGWGPVLYSVVTSLDVGRKVNIKVVPLVGGMGQIPPLFQANELARQLAEAFGGAWQELYAPVFVGERVAREALVRLKDIQIVLQAWSALDWALVDVGHLEFQNQSSMFFAEYIDSSTLQQLKAAGAVGDLCGRFFNSGGEPCGPEEGIVSISLEQLRALDGVIGVAGGPEKVPAILGALRGGYLNVLITDEITAQTILARHQAKE
ncbi:MAG: sugar-binding transcriptional regulator [Anaerolineae bacterium]|jgi:DNA-binding transcriptional regulator LsrR (DeoR family)|nr:sugar-binding transcriptional regulator [Anaerolineae bacterium]MDH7474324.1 sugar-binding transcriptional regulator [Anaerolineae bacterium]